MVHKHCHRHSEDAEEWDGAVWGADEVELFSRGKPGRCVLLLDGFVVDSTSYLSEHVCHLSAHGIHGADGFS